MLSQWLELFGWANLGSANSAGQLLEGSPLDRFFLTALAAIAFVVLAQRRQQVLGILRANGPLIAFILYCGLSTLWSDYTDVAFKRWIKLLSDLAMVLIVLTEREPATAVKRVLTRVGFLLLPGSVLLIKYFPDLGGGWSRWGGFTGYTGVTLSKNELGGICLLFGIGFAWRFVDAYWQPRRKGRMGALLVHGSLAAMALWLLRVAGAMTAFSCFMIVIMLLVLTSFRSFARRRWILHAYVTSVLLVSFLALFAGVGSGLVETIGRDTTLTGRTAVWALVLRMTGNPLFGTGFESFWLGPRLEKIWQTYWWHPNEAHNGYIEVFLNLGWIGVLLLAILMFAAYRNAMRAYRNDRSTGMLRLAYFIVAVIYNFTESSIREMHPVWLFLLLATIAVPNGWTRITAKNEEPAPDLSDEMSMRSVEAAEQLPADSEAAFA